ncbi:MAG: hypothetical protein KDD61_14920 [Bdellovibrionales bacterium]|nr:hypothetical protein [Bdellovibrionales bacterium]
MLVDLEQKLQKVLEEQGADACKQIVLKDLGESPEEQRLRSYFLAKALMWSSDYLGAVSILKKLEREGKAHISVLGDLACCYYFLGDIIACRSTLKELEDRYEKVFFLLSRESRLRTLSLMAKFYEEFGRISLALLTYEKIISEFDLLKENKRVYLSISHWVRVASEFLPRTHWMDRYCELKSVRSQWESHISIEVEHSLFLAEIYGYGLPEALIRLNNRISLESLVEEDRDLFYHEWLLAWLQEDDQTVTNLPEALLKWTPQSVDDQILKFCALQDRKSLEALSDRRNELMPAAKLRLNPLLQHRSLGFNRQVLNDEVQVALNNLSDDERQLWKKRISKHLVKEIGITISLDLQRKELNSSLAKVSLSRRPTSYELCCCFIENKSWSVDSLIEKMWPHGRGEESFFHRLRMQLNRLNQSFFELTGQAHLILLQDKKVTFLGDLIEKRDSYEN